MPLSKQIKLAHAKRRLKDFEDDRSLFEARHAGFSQAERATLMEMFDAALLQHREYVKNLENELEKEWTSR